MRALYGQDKTKVRGNMLGTKILHSDVLGFLKIDQGTPRVDFEQDRVKGQRYK